MAGLNLTHARLSAWGTGVITVSPEVPTESIARFGPDIRGARSTVLIGHALLSAFGLGAVSMSQAAEFEANFSNSAGRFSNSGRQG